jgi:hypothetical protein
LALTDGLGDYDVEEADESQSRRLMMAPVARWAGRPPPQTKQLTLFPTPASKSSKRFDTLAHPILLFEKLDKLDPQKAPPSGVDSVMSGRINLDIKKERDMVIAGGIVRHKPRPMSSLSSGK